MARLKVPYPYQTRPPLKVLVILRVLEVVKCIREQYVCLLLFITTKLKY